MSPVPPDDLLVFPTTRHVINRQEWLNSNDDEEASRELASQASYQPKSVSSPPSGLSRGSLLRKVFGKGYRPEMTARETAAARGVTGASISKSKSPERRSPVLEHLRSGFYNVLDETVDEPIAGGEQPRRVFPPDISTYSSRGRRSPVNASTIEEVARGARADGINKAVVRRESFLNGHTPSVFSSMTESESTAGSRCQVHDFLQESSGGSGSGKGSGSHGSGSGSDGGGLSQKARMQMDMLDAEDINFLRETRELREAMLGVEDLHFGE